MHRLVAHSKFPPFGYRLILVSSVHSGDHQYEPCVPYDGLGE